MKVEIITVAYNMPHYNRRLIKSALLDADKHDIMFRLFLHSKHEETVKGCLELMDKFPVRFYDYRRNRGLSRSWNEGIVAFVQSGADVLIIANDDIFFSPGDLDRLARKAFDSRDNYMVSVAGPHIGEGHEKAPSHGYSCFALNPIGIERVGMFDENIFPIYLEDCDHHYRATRLGLVETNCDNTMISHQGSSAINNDELLSIQNLVTQRKSGEYYRRKWSGLNGHETFTMPFDDPRFGMYIDPRVRDAPYPGYNRTDRDEIVRR
jgi:GT2 family glycosyltransferase